LNAKCAANQKRLRTTDIESRNAQDAEVFLGRSMRKEKKEVGSEVKEKDENMEPRSCSL